MNSSPHFSPRAQAVTAAPLWKRRQKALAVSFLLAWPAFYSARSLAASAPSAAQVAPMTLRVGKSLQLPLAPGDTFSFESGASLARYDASNDTLNIRALSPGLVRLRLQKANGSFSTLALRFVTSKEASSAAEAAPAVERRVSSQVASPAPTSPDPLSVIPPIPPNLGGSGQSANAGNVNTNGGANAGNVNTNSGSDTGAIEALPTVKLPTPDQGVANTTPALPQPSAGASERAPIQTARPATTATRVNPAPAQTAPPLEAVPAATGPQVIRPSLPTSTQGSSVTSRETRISPVLPAPSPTRRANVSYRTTPRLPRTVSERGPRPGVQVTQGLARLVSFPDNILSVFFSNPAVMDARAINARTIAVTGTGLGTSTLAVFTSRYPGDAVGRANIYRVQTVAQGGAAAALANNPSALEAAITSALGDPRVKASVVRLPDGTLAARLQGIVRNEAEVTGAVSTASFYVPRVVSSLYADANAPSIDAVRSGPSPASPSVTDTLQESLRRLTGNSSIELVALPTGLAVKATTDSPEEAEALLRILPTLNQPVVPFIVVRGLANTQSPYYNSEIPLLQGEDRQLTDKLQAVTGIRTVYATRASSNSVAIYGQVRTRGEYETVKRYGLVVAQNSQPAAIQGTAQGGAVFRPQGSEGPILPAYDPAGGYLRDLGVQMFVRILDPAEATVRNVNVETNVVEISRTALQNLGVQFGTAQLTAENVTPGSSGTVTVLRDAAGNPVIGTNGQPVTQTTGATPTIINRTINPSFSQGLITAGNGFAGGGALQFLDPFRAQLNALAQKGDARILARPTLRAVEGMPAQIVIGGSRPVPSAVATTGAVGTAVEFRPFGVIISMRPTVSDDNTIVMQIRADITQPDPTYAINLNGAIIPGESVRSVDTTLTVRPGDVVVMGGLITNEKRAQTSKVPVLGDIPIIGSLFKSKRFENNETELAIFMTPRIDSLPATPTTQAIIERNPALPALPSRQEGQGIIFQSARTGP